MKARVVLLLLLIGASAPGSAFAAPPPAAAEGGTLAALAAAMDGAGVSEDALIAALREETEALHAIADTETSGNSRQVGDALGNLAAPGVKARLKKFFHDFGQCVEHDHLCLKKAAVTTLELGGYAADGAGDLVLFPFRFMNHFVSAAVGNDAGATQWIAAGAGASVYAPVAFNLTIAVVAALGAPVAFHYGIGALCSIPSLLFTSNGLTAFGQYCNNLGVVDDKLEDGADKGGDDSGRWVGGSVRKIGHDVRAIFMKLFRAKKKKAPAPVPAAT